MNAPAPINRELVRALRPTHTLKQLGARFGVSMMCISRICHGLDGPDVAGANRGRVTEAQMVIARRVLRAGRLGREAVEASGISYRTIRAKRLKGLLPAKPVEPVSTTTPRPRIAKPTTPEWVRSAGLVEDFRDFSDLYGFDHAHRACRRLAAEAARP